MNDELYRKILRMKALQRWENEGGRIIEDQTEKNMDGSTHASASTYMDSDGRDDEQRNGRQVTHKGG